MLKKYVLLHHSLVKMRKTSDFAPFFFFFFLISGLHFIVYNMKTVSWLSDILQGVSMFSS